MTQAWAWAAGLAALAVASAWADTRQARRRDLDRPGWVPWQFLSVLAAVGALGAAVVALKT